MLQLIVFLTFYGINGAPPPGATPQGINHPPSVSERANISSIISSMVEKGPTKSGDDVMWLPDDLVFDALVGNVDTLQEQIELCEEELIEKVGSIRMLRHGQPAIDNAKSQGGKTTMPLLKGEFKNPSDVEEDDKEEDKATKVGRVLKRRARGVSNTVAETESRSEVHDALVRELVNRLSSRLDYFKTSLAQCYGLFQTWNKKHYL